MKQLSLAQSGKRGTASTEDKGYPKIHILAIGGHAALERMEVKCARIEPQDLCFANQAAGQRTTETSLTTYTHWFERREGSDLGAQLAAPVDTESGPDLAE